MIRLKRTKILKIAWRWLSKIERETWPSGCSKQTDSSSIRTSRSEGSTTSPTLLSKASRSWRTRYFSSWERKASILKRCSISASQQRQTKLSHSSTCASTASTEVESTSCCKRLNYRTWTSSSEYRRRWSLTKEAKSGLSTTATAFHWQIVHRWDLGRGAASPRLMPWAFSRRSARIIEDRGMWVSVGSEMGVAICPNCQSGRWLRRE